MATWTKVVVENGTNTIAQTSSGITGVTLGALATLNTVGTSQIDNDSITAAKIQDEVITYDKIAPNTIGAGVLNVSGNGSSGQILASDGDGSFSWVDDAQVTVDASLSSISANPVENHVVYDALALKASLAGSSSQNFNANDLTVAGDLTVSGTTTIVNTEEINLADNAIVFNSNHDANTAPSQDSGITVNRGSSTDQSFYWDESTDKWSIGHTESGGQFTSTANVAMIRTGAYVSSQTLSNGFGAVGSFQLTGTSLYVRTA